MIACAGALTVSRSVLCAAFGLCALARASALLAVWIETSGGYDSTMQSC